MFNEYSHLYSGVNYQPPSIRKKIEEASPRENEVYGDSRLGSMHSIESVTGQSSMDYLIDHKLQNRDLYREMKNKTLYSTSSEILAHSMINNF